MGDAAFVGAVGHLVAREFTHDLTEDLAAQDRRAFPVDLGGDVALDAHLEVGRDEVQPIALSFDVDPFEDLHALFARRGSFDNTDSANELIALTDKLQRAHPLL